MSISAIVITKNEEANLPRCLRSAAWVDEIVVVDANSSDATVEIAGRFNAKVFIQEFRGFGPAKQHALEQAGGDWVLSIDADEEISLALKDEIQTLSHHGPACSGYYIPRKTQLLGKWIMHSGWYPDYVLRLFRRSAGRFTASLVHERVDIEGATGRLHHPLLHYSYPTLEHYVRKLDLFSTLAAEDLFRQGRQPSRFLMTVKPLLAFWRKLVFQKGYKDGWEGYLIACLTSTGILLRYAKLRSLYLNAEKARPSPPSPDAS